VTFTGLVTSVTRAGFKPERLAVTVIVPGVMVDLTDTRLIPSSVLPGIASAAARPSDSDAAIAIAGRCFFKPA